MSGLYQKYLTYKKNKETNKRLLKACLKNDLDIVNECTQLEHNINYRNSKGYTPFLLCCSMGYLELAKVIESKGGNILEVDNENRNGYLIASINGHIDVMEYLETKHININQLDCFGNNAYILASKYGQVKSLMFLEKHGCAYKYHRNYSNKDAFTIHKYFVLCPAVSNYENIRRSVSYLAGIGYESCFTSKNQHIADIYYQIYYKLNPNTFLIPKQYKNKCMLCEKKFLKNQLVFMCGHEHLTHVNCLIYYSNVNIHSHRSSYFMHGGTSKHLQNCIVCNEPYLLQQKNVRKINYIQEIQTPIDNDITEQKLEEK